MEGKEKIVLKDGTVVEIENGAGVNLIRVSIQSLDDFKGLFENFTEDNLEKYTVQNADGLTCTTLENKYLEEAGVKRRADDFLVSLHLADVDMVEKRLNAIEAEQEATKTGQAIQDGAIADLGEILAGMMEGGEA